MSEAGENETESRAPAPDQVFAPGQPFALKQSLRPAPTRRPSPGRGRRSQTTAVQQGGHYLRAIIPQGPVRDLALEATLRAAAIRRVSEKLKIKNEQLKIKNEQFLPSSTPPTLHPSNFAHDASSNLPSFPPSLLPSDLRTKLRRARVGNLILFVVDASGSMGARQRMIAVKGAILSLLLDAYQKRDRVGLITFRGAGAQLLVPPTNSVELAERCLRQLPTGGRTPLVAALHLADQVLANYLRKDAALTPLLVLITDGRANSTDYNTLRQTTIQLGQKKLATLVLDSEQGLVRLGLAREVARWLGAEYLPLDRLAGEPISRVVKQLL